MSRPGQYKTGDGFQFLWIPLEGEPVYIKIKKERRWRGLSLPTDGVDQAPSAWGSSQIQGWSRALHQGFTQTVDQRLHCGPGSPPLGQAKSESLPLGQAFPISRDPLHSYLNPSRARNARPICEGSGKKSAKRVLARGLWGRKALWRKASRDRTKESAFAAFGGSLAQALIPFECAFGNTECLSRKRLA